MTATVPELEDRPAVAGRVRRRPPGEGRLRRRGHLAGGPRWATPALLVLLAGTAVLYLWGLGASGNANSFYAAAVQAGTKSWKAFFFGSIDSSNFITVDKPPASLWVMALSGRIFGFSSWSMLAPQALEGVAAVGLLYAAVRRWAGPVAGLAAGAMLALTPVATLMFRFNNPDALLVLLLVAGAYCMVRALEVAGTRWLVLAGTAIGFAFLTKMMQAFLVVPAFGLVYLVTAPTTLWRRIWQVLVGLAAVVVSAGWWVAAVELWPKNSRPYIGGSTDNSLLNLVFGYNGLGRLTGGSAGGNGASFSGQTGWTRLFGSEMGTEISWLLPAALVALVGGLVVTARMPRTDRTRAALLLWGAWLLVTGGVFSFAGGTIHPYYTVALAPAIAALIAVGCREFWRTRESLVSRAFLGATVAAAGIWSYKLLARTPSWHPELRYVVIVAAVLAGLALVVGGRLVAAGTVGVALAAVVGTAAAPAAYSLSTASVAHTGSMPASGPTGQGSMGGGGGGGFGGGTRPSGTGTAPGGTTGTTTRGTASTGVDDTSTSSALTTLLKKSGSTYRWAAAAVGSQSAASLELSSGAAVMSIGGFTGSDPAPTLAQFEAYVAAGDIHYFVSSEGGGMGGGGNSAITTWVAAHYTAKTVGGQTVYDLTAPKA